MNDYQSSAGREVFSEVLESALGEREPARRSEWLQNKVVRFIGVVGVVGALALTIPDQLQQNQPAARQVAIKHNLAADTAAAVAGGTDFADFMNSRGKQIVAIANMPGSGVGHVLFVGNKGKVCQKFKVLAPTETGTVAGFEVSTARQPGFMGELTSPVTGIVLLGSSAHGVEAGLSGLNVHRAGRRQQWVVGKKFGLLRDELGCGSLPDNGTVTSETVVTKRNLLGVEADIDRQIAMLERSIAPQTPFVNAIPNS